MGKLSLKDFSGGLSKKLKSHAIADNEAVEAQNIDFSGFALRSSEGVDTSKKSGENVDGNGHYHHKQEWITDPSAQSFEKFGDYVIKTYSDDTPKVTKVVQGATNTEEPLGVPRKPGSKLASAVVSEGDIGEKNCFAYPVLEVGQWGQENVIDTTGDVTFAVVSTNNRITLTGMAGGKPFEKIQGPKFAVDSQIYITGSASNDGRYKITAVDSTNFEYIEVKESFKAAGTQSVSIRIKTQGGVDDASNTLTDVDTLANSDSEDMIHYAPTLGKFTSYNETTGKATIYDTNGSGNDNTSAALPNRGYNEKFLGDWFRTNDTDGASFCNLGNAVVPVESVSFTTSDAVGLTGITRTVNSVRNFTSAYLASTKSKGTMTYPSETVKGRKWLESGKKYLIIDTISAPAGYTLYKQNASTGNREEVTISWTKLSMDLDTYNGRTNYDLYNYYTTPTLTSDYLLNSSTPDNAKVYEVTGDTTHTVTGTDLTKRETQHIREERTYYPGGLSTKWGDHFRTHYRVTPTITISNGGKSIVIGPFETASRHRNWANYQGGPSPTWGPPNGYYTKSWSATSIWENNITSNSMTNVAVEETYFGEDDDCVQSRVLSYTLGSNSNTTTAQASSRMIGKLTISDSTTSSTTPPITSASITSHDKDGNVTGYDWREGFRVGDKVKIIGSKWNDTDDAKITAVDGGSMSIEGMYGEEQGVITVDGYALGGDFTLNPEENFPSHYGVMQNDGTKTYLKGYDSSDNSHTESWGRFEITGTAPIVYGETYSNVPYFIIKTTTDSAFKVERVRLESTLSKISFTIEKHNLFHVQPNRITVSGQDADIVIYNFSGNTVYSRDGAGTSLGMNASQKVNRGWFDVDNTRVILELLDKTLVVIKPDATDPSQSVLRAPFNHFLHYDTSGHYFFGVTKSDDGKYSKIQKIRPFYYNEIKEGQRITHQDVTPASSGIIVKSLKKKDVDRFRFLLVDFVGSNSGWEDPSATSENTFRFFLPGHTTSNERYFDFESTVAKDVVLFDEGENNIPQEGSKTVNDQMTFYNNYDYGGNQDISSYYYFVLKKEHLAIHSDHKLHAHQLTSGDPSNQTAYGQEINTHGIGETQFFVGAPNMYDSLGAQLPFRYQVAFLDSNGREGPPCEITDEITSVETANDSVQLSMNSTFLGTAIHPSGVNMVEKIRVYRYGGNYSKFKWLADRDVKDVVANGLPYNVTANSSDLVFISSSVGDQVHAWIRTPHFNSTGLDLLKNYAGSTISVSGFSNSETINGQTLLYNNGQMRVINITKQSFTATNKTISSIAYTSASTTTATVTGHNFVVNQSVRIVGTSNFNGDVVVASTSESPPHTVVFTQAVDSSTTTETSGSAFPQFSVLRVQAHPSNERLLQTISGTKQSVIGYGGTTNTVEEANKNITIAVTEFGYRDRERHPPVTGLVPQYDAHPPFVLDTNGDLKPNAYFSNITNVGGIFFSSNGSRVRFSHFNNPHSWPVLGYVDVDSTVTGIKEYFGEGLVFTSNSLYRLRGNSPEQMSLVKIPDNQGLPLSYRKTLCVVDGTVIWISNDGICMYDSGRVRVLTLNKFDDFPVLNNPIGVAQDRVVYFLQEPDPNGIETRLGVKMDLSYGEPKITRTTVEANHAIYITELDQLYVNNTVDNDKSGSIGGGDILPLVFKSKSFDFGDMNEHKALLHLEADYKSLDVLKRDTLVNGVHGSEAVREYLNTADGGNLNVAESIIDNYRLNQSYADNRIEAELELGTVTDSISSDAASSEYLVDIDTEFLTVGMYAWGERIKKGSKITEIVSSSQLKLSLPALSTGADTLYFGDLPRISIYTDESDTAIGVIYPYPGEGDFVSTDLYLNDYKVFRTMAFKFEGVLEVREISINAEPIHSFKKHTLFHSLDMNYTGTVELVLTVDGTDVYMNTYTAQQGADEERVYIPSSTFGTVPYFKNNSHLGRISSLKFNSHSMHV